MTKQEIHLEIAKLKSSKAYNRGRAEEHHYIDEQINRLCGQLNNIGMDTSKIPSWMLAEKKRRRRIKSA